MRRLIQYLRHYRDHQHVRPWALAVPLAVILISLPLLRPVLHPHPATISDDEVARLATVQAIVEYHTLAINHTLPRPVDNTIEVGKGVFSNQPPVFSALLSATYWVLHRWDITMARSGPMVAFILTLVGVTLPVAGAAGFVYRMGRVFELERRWRTLLAALVVFGSGLVSYATVLNSHAPAAAALICAAACLIHIVIARHPRSEGAWVVICGLCAALAAVVDLTTAPFLLLLPAVVLTMPWTGWKRFRGIALFLLGTTPPLLLHAVLTIPVTGDVLPGSMHPDLAIQPVLQPMLDQPDADDLIVPEPWWAATGRVIGQLLGTLLGAHGILSHFPLVIMGVVGVFAVMHRHWPATTKILAAGAAAGTILILIGCVTWVRDWREAMFANRWAVAVLPLVVFWMGAWLRKKHRPLSWAVAGCLAAFSIAVTVIGATSPQPRGGYDGYSAAGAMRIMIKGQDIPPEQQSLARSRM